MALRLRVVGNQAKLLGDGASRVFGVHGGTIGRSGDNDWILPDPERYISGKHARVEYRAGTYWFHDTSSNGTYLNGATDPLSATGPHQLQDGDRLRMGDFELVVSIDAANDFPPEKSAIVAYDGLGQSSHSRQSTENDIGAALNLDALLASDDSGSRMNPVNAYGQAVVLEPLQPLTPKPRVSPKHPPAAAKATAEPAIDPVVTQVPWNLATRRIEPFKNPVKPPAAAEAPRVSSENLPSHRNPSSEPAPARAEAAQGSDSSGLQMLCRGAGIDPSSIPVHLQPQVLLIAGQILRELMFGIMDVQQARTELRNRFRIVNNGSAPEEHNPLNFSGGVEEALRRLFEQRSSRYLGPVEAIRESFRDVKAHHQAMAAAMQAAFGEVLSRLDPAELQDRFDRGMKRGGLLGTMSNKSKYWDLYTEFYPSLGVAPKGELPHLFCEEFARAYEAKLKELATRQQRTPSGRREDAERLATGKS